MVVLFLSIGLIIVAVVLIEYKWKLISRKFHPWLKDNATLLGAYRSLIAFIAFPLVIVGGVYTYIQILERLETPDVQLTLQYPKSVAVSIRNTSRVVVRDPKYQVVLFNIDSAANQRNEPLPIPVAKGDYIKSGEQWGPNSMISIPSVQSRVHDGDRLLGWAYVTCPTGPRHFYWIYFQHGKGGWFAEMNHDEYPNMANFPNLLQEPEAAMAAYHSHVPEEKRIPIK